MLLTYAAALVFALFNVFHGPIFTGYVFSTLGFLATSFFPVLPFSILLGLQTLDTQPEYQRYFLIQRLARNSPSRIRLKVSVRSRPCSGADCQS